MKETQFTEEQRVEKITALYDAEADVYAASNAHFAFASSIYKKFCKLLKK